MVSMASWEKEKWILHIKFSWPSCQQNFGDNIYRPYGFVEDEGLHVHQERGQNYKHPQMNFDYDNMSTPSPLKNHVQIIKSCQKVVTIIAQKIESRLHKLLVNFSCCIQLSMTRQFLVNYFPISPIWTIYRNWNMF